MEKNKYRNSLILILGVWLSLAFFAWIKSPNAISMDERRKLATFPKIQLETVMNGRYIQSFETYSLDQFPFRQKFRRLKSISEIYMLRKKDNHDIYLSEGYAVKMEYPLQASSIENVTKKMNAIYETYGKGISRDVYVAIVPDKGYFLGEQSGHLTLDYLGLSDMVKRDMPYAHEIDIASQLEISDYYKTDSHWKQEEIVDVAKKIAMEMGTSISGKYEIKTVPKPFYGVYYGQSALPLEPDTMHYLTNDNLDQCKVYNVDTKETTGLFDEDKLESRDLYDVYLSGGVSVLYIENPNFNKKKELVVFRDSFASSLLPLLAEGYSKITLVDPRYIPPSMLGEYVDFKDADLLFLYSTTILNNSQSFR